MSASILEMKESPKEPTREMRLEKTLRILAQDKKFPNAALSEFVFRFDAPNGDAEWGKIMADLSSRFQKLDLHGKSARETNLINKPGSTMILKQLIFRSDMFTFVVGNKKYEINADISSIRMLEVNDVDSDVFDAFFDYLQNGSYNMSFAKKLALPEPDERVGHNTYQILIKLRQFCGSQEAPLVVADWGFIQHWRPPVEAHCYVMSFHIDLLTLADKYQVEALKWSCAYHLSAIVLEELTETRLMGPQTNPIMGELLNHVYRGPYPQIVHEALVAAMAVTDVTFPSGLDELEKLHKAMQSEHLELSGDWPVEDRFISQVEVLGTKEHQIRFLERRFLRRFWEIIAKEDDGEALSEFNTWISRQVNGH